MANAEPMENTSDYPEMAYFMNEALSDFVFIIDGQRVPVLKSVVSFKSNVFKAMFARNSTEANPRLMWITETTLDAFKAMIRYLYSEQLVLRRVGMEGEDCQLAIDVYKLGHKYELKRLMTRTLNKLKTMITTENIDLIYGLANDYNLTELTVLLERFINTHFSEIVSRDANELIDINESSENYLLETLAQKFQEREQFFRPLNQMPETFVINGMVYKKIGPNVEEMNGRAGVNITMVSAPPSQPGSGQTARRSTLPIGPVVAPVPIPSAPPSQPSRRHTARRSAVSFGQILASMSTPSSLPSQPQTASRSTVPFGPAGAPMPITSSSPSQSGSTQTARPIVPFGRIVASVPTPAPIN